MKKTVSKTNRIVVLLQGDIPIELVIVPEIIKRDFEVEQFVTKIRENRLAILRNAYIKLHPTMDPKRIGPSELPDLATYVLPVTYVEDVPS